MNIFVIDDEIEICETVCDVLRDTYPNISYFTDPLKALEAIHKEPPSLIITDYRMPEMDGIELCSEVKAHYHSLPIILLTGNADKDVAIAALGAGFEDIIEKPFKTIDLKKTISHWLR